MDKKRKKIGLVLGGGGGKGMAHIGVLKVLEENNIPIDLVIGTSMGAAVGALHSLGLHSEEIEQIFLEEINWKDMVHLASPTFNDEFMGGDKLEKWIYQLVEGKTFEDVETPLVITAVDLNSGERVSIKEGDVASAVRASISAPPAIKPIQHQGKLLGDGWLAGPLPADIAKQMGMDIIIGVYLDTEKATKQLDENNIGAIEYLNRGYNILSNHLLAYEEKNCDVVIKPSIGGISVGGGVEEFLNKKAIVKDITAGEEATVKNLDAIKKLF